MIQKRFCLIIVSAGVDLTVARVMFLFLNLAYLIILSIPNDQSCSHKGNCIREIVPKLSRACLFSSCM